MAKRRKVKERRVLFAMCAMGKCDGCSGIIQSGEFVTRCTCECHKQRQLEGET